ncbi:DeoR/GlpR family transcriptional regulator of sugar metabolism [Nesterenkonia halotolerans]|uniref:DeoR/GlpR family transcriptional regulator of sugar metabolism n=1 Tax=Nesterenkonia halotolerans TaxID=225325 RepID=A0ABR9J624_9MICC|nr:DeoR/GlpR family transcriptional regulator of sugar metabolism [Nesterenkonia halotolerans]
MLSVKELCSLLKVSHMTVRRDISALESEGEVHSVPGGVRISRSIRIEPTYQDKSTAHLAAKRAMAAHAATMIRSGQTVFLDAGTTVGHVVQHLEGKKDLTLVTNDLTTAVRLSDISGLDVFQIGGHVDVRNRSTVGLFAAGMLGHFNFDLALMSTSSWDSASGVTTPSEAKVGVKQAAMSNSAMNVLVSGSEKYGLIGTFNVAPLDLFDQVITDSSMPSEELAQLSEAGVKIHVTET